jgi:hypothetical protein
LNYNIIAPVLIFVFGFAFQAEGETINYPRAACTEIVSSDFSAPGGESSVNIYEILCKDSSGKYTTFTTTWQTAGSFFGLGRYTSPERIDLVPYDGNVLSIE